ncbi:MAG: pantetheine-phosphate adenylyltransferase [Sandaracinaceae bacterium]|nr:pantetheine-phosphate adenylyltransferase [Sandaracinaceae bacterium]
MTIAVYAGTFDPFTFGHLSVVKEAVRLFSHVRVLVAVHPTKEPLFDLAERIAMAREVVGRMPTVSCDGTAGMVVDYAREIGGTVLVRGLRGEADAAYETRLAQNNRELGPEILTVMLPAEPALSVVSSTELKRRARAGEPIESFCPPVVAKRLVARLAGDAS